MYAYPQSNPFVLSSACPSSCALVAFALRLGGTIDPEFLHQCQISDPKFQKAVDSLKAVPLKFEPPLHHYGHHEDMFLDIGASDGMQFYDSWAFKEHNSWLGTSDRWHSTYALDDELMIDFI